MREIEKVMMVVGLTIIVLWSLGLMLEPMQSPAQTPAMEPSIVYVPVPAPVPTTSLVLAHAPIPEHDVPYHALGDRKTCGTCHQYPSFDENNDPYMSEGAIFEHPSMETSEMSQNAFGRSRNVRSTYNMMPIPDEYYSQGCMLPTDVPMQEYLADSRWTDDYQYEANAWDCSQMAAYMEWMLENCGYHVVIRLADVEGEENGHAWILVEFEQGMLAYECTGRYWVYPSEDIGRSYNPDSSFSYNPSMYDAGIEYESIYDVWEDFKGYSNGEEAFMEEFGWWNN